MITAVKRLMMVTAAEGIAAVLPENPYAWEFVLHLLMFIMLMTSNKVVIPNINNLENRLEEVTKTASTWLSMCL